MKINIGDAPRRDFSFLSCRENCAVGKTKVSAEGDCTS
jgi:hypothetical protein